MLSKSLFFKVVLVSAIYGGLTPAASEIRSYGYLARQIPASGQNCHEQAKELASRFTSLTGLASTGRCKEITKEGNDILINYQSENPLNVISSMPDLGFPSQGYEFGTKDQCDLAIPIEVESFKKIVGSEPLFSFCRGQENYYGLVRWALVMEGFGQPKVQIGWSSSLFPGQPTREQIKKVQQEVKSTFSDARVNVRQVFLQSDDHGHLRLNVTYYGKYNEQLKAFSLANVNSLVNCQDALQELEKIKTQNNSVKTLGYCVNNPYEGGATLVTVFDVTNWYKFRQSAETFGSYDECFSSKDGLVDLYNANYPEKILGGFCTRWGSQWRLNLIAEPSTRS